MPLGVREVLVDPREDARTLRVELGEWKVGHGGKIPPGGGSR
jgi:hypothetical protein